MGENNDFSTSFLDLLNFIAEQIVVQNLSNRGKIDDQRSRETTQTTETQQNGK